MNSMAEGGDDYLNGGAGADFMVGADGNDIYIVDNFGDNVAEDGADSDDEIRTSVVIGNDVQNIEHYTYTGSANWTFTTSAGYNNRITGGSGRDLLNGNDGNDKLCGNGGNDTLIGGTGEDELDGGAGNDKMRGGTGNDTYMSMPATRSMRKPIPAATTTRYLRARSISPSSAAAPSSTPS